MLKKTLTAALLGATLVLSGCGTNGDDTVNTGDTGTTGTVGTLTFAAPNFSTIQDIYAALSPVNVATTASTNTVSSGQEILVGRNGQILTTPDGVTFTTQTSGTTSFLDGVTYGNGLYVVVGDAGTILTSTDAVTWTARTGTASGNAYYAVTFGANQFVAVGENGLISTSPDGVTWTDQSSGITGNFTGVAFGNGVYVATEDTGGLETSTDGVTWTARNIGNTFRLQAVSFGTPTTGTSEFIAVGQSGLVITSTTGITWSSLSGVPNDVDLYGVAIGTHNEVIVTGGFLNSDTSSYTAGEIYTSIAGGTLTNQSAPTTNVLFAPAVALEHFIVGGANGALLVGNTGVTYTSL